MNTNRGRTVMLRAALFGVGLSAAAAAQTWTYELVHAFSEEGLPESGLIEAADGNLYGTTPLGGKAGVGTVYRIDASGTLTTIHSFGYADGAFPRAALMQAADGYFYGTTAGGGVHNQGTVFRMDPSGGVVVLHSFDGVDGDHPTSALIQALDGNFYGTAGKLFRMDWSGTLTTLNMASRSPLVHATDGSYFYGIRSLCGPFGCSNYLFRMDASGNLTTLLYGIVGAFMQAQDGNFYGTRGAILPTYPHGTVFKVDRVTGVQTVLHTFNGGDGSNPGAALVQSSDGGFYGTTTLGGAGGFGTAFKMNASGDVTTLHDFDYSDGGDPRAALIQATDDNFYGTTWYGGPNSWGTVFRVATSGTFATVGSFGGSATGVEPTAALLLAAGGELFGTTDFGGPGNRGAIYRLSASGQLRTLHAFGLNEGQEPQGGLTQGTDGRLYGTAEFGGSGTTNFGTIFAVNTAGELTVLHDFLGTDGANPLAGLVRASDGNLYGTASGAGAGGFGTIFQLSPSGSFATLHDFTGAGDGAYPQTGLMEAEDGYLYGTTPSHIFRIDTLGNLTSLFDWPGEAYPQGLTQGTDGSLYGATESGSDGTGDGTLFRLDLSGNFTTLHTFDTEVDGAYPLGGLIQGSDGFFYGTTSAGSQDGRGTIFRLSSSGELTTLHSFNGIDGAGPHAALTQTQDGAIYGTAWDEGPAGDGVVFRLTSSMIAANAIVPTSGPASGATAVEILGGGFAADSTLAIGAGLASSVTVLDPAFLYAFTASLTPGTLNDAIVTNPDNAPNSSATLPHAYFADFLDVPQSDIFHDYIETIFRAGITAGYGDGNYGRDDSVTRAQMAVLLLKAEHGSTFSPPACSGVFADVVCTPGVGFPDWIERLAAEGITGGCFTDPLRYCPDRSVTRAEMAVLLLKTQHGIGYQPPACVGIFADVPCPSTPGFPYSDWIEQLAAEGVTAGCGHGNYCPEDLNTRGQMAVFLVKTFNLQ